MPIRYDFERYEEGYSSWAMLAGMLETLWELMAEIKRQGTYFSLPRDCKYKNVIKSRQNPIRHPNTLASDHG